MIETAKATAAGAPYWFAAVLGLAGVVLGYEVAVCQVVGLGAATRGKRQRLATWGE